MFIQSRTQKANNEDAWAAGNGLWIVCDGASSLSKVNHLDPVSDAAWLAQQTAVRMTAHDPELFLQQNLKIVLEELAAVYPDVDELDQPSEAVAMLRKNQDRLEYLVLGDCVLLIRHRGLVFRITDPVIGTFDQRALDAMAEASRKTGQPFLSCRLCAQAILEENRRKKNRSDGYWIADLSGRWFIHAQKGCVSVDGFEGALLFSDGFDQLQEFLQLNDADFFAKVWNDPQAALDLLYMLQENDPQAEKVHRLKIRDDTTLMVVTPEDL